MSKYFGPDKDGYGSSTPTPAFYRLLGRLVLGLAGLIVLSSSVKVIGVGQVGVVTRFGQISREWNEGIHIKFPFVERVTRFDVRVQKEQADAAAASHDLQDVHSTLAVNYHLERGKVSDIYRSVGPDYKKRLIDPAIQESFKATSSSYTAAQLITERPLVKQKALEILRQRLEQRGIFIDDLSIVNFEFSKDFTQAIESKQVAAQEAERAKFNLERAKLDAAAQNLQKESLSAAYLQKLAIDKWNGVLPSYLGSGTVFNIPLK